jgi:hypothetical protein
MQGTQTSLFSMPCQPGSFGGMQAMQLSDPPDSAAGNSRPAPDQPGAALRAALAHARHQILSIGECQRARSAGITPRLAGLPRGAA